MEEGDLNRGWGIETRDSHECYYRISIKRRLTMAQAQPSDPNKPKPLEAEPKEEGMIVQDLRGVQFDTCHPRFLGARSVVYSSRMGGPTRSDHDRDWDWK